MRKKPKPKLAGKPEIKKVRAAYEMATPNDSLDAFGWDLGKLRYPSVNSADPKNPDPGRGMFTAEQETAKTMKTYGHDARFICPRYLQILCDKSPEIRAAAEEAHNARYTKSSIANIQAAIQKFFDTVVAEDIETNFRKIAPFVAQFYAARMAHIKKFGADAYA